MHIYSEIADTLKKRIKFGMLPPGTLLPPEVELAEQLGVSRKTLRSALDILASEQLISRRKHVGTEICADAMRRVEIELTVAVVMDMPEDSLVNPLRNLLFRQMTNETDMLLQQLIRDGVTLQITVPGAMRQLTRFDGAIVSAPMQNTEVLEFLAERKIPHLALESCYEYPGVLTVMGDDEQAAYDCTSELIAAGHRDILLIGGPLKPRAWMTGFRRRANGYLRACRENGIEPPPEYLFQIEPEDEDSLSMDSLLADFAKRTRGADAMVCALGTSILELERLRELCGEARFPRMAVRCVDLHPFDRPDAWSRLEKYQGFCKPHHAIATSGFNLLMQWIGCDSFAPRCVKIPFEKNNTIQPTIS